MNLMICKKTKSKHKKGLLILIAILFYALQITAQNDRIKDYNNLVWLQSINNFKLGKKATLMVEYNMRRAKFVKDWQQSLLRIGVNFPLNEQINLHTGFGYAETFVYGDYPIAANGTFPELRWYEQVNLKQVLKKNVISHRFRIEQRFTAKLQANTQPRKIDEWVYTNRFRYQFRYQYNFNSKWYGAIANELFINAGKNVGVNIFDQNRLQLFGGLRITKQFALEFGYMNLLIQQGRRVNNQTIVQNNNVVTLTSHLNLF